MEYVITFVDRYSMYAILIPSKDHTAQTVSNVLLDHVILYFGVPRRLLSDRSSKFTGQVWDELLRALGIQKLFTSPYRQEDNAINEHSHPTMNNILCAFLYTDASPLPKWVGKIPAIMLTLNSMPHQLHGYSTSMIVTGQETTLPPDLITGANPSEGEEDPSVYVSRIQERLREIHLSESLCVG